MSLDELVERYAQFPSEEKLYVTENGNYTVTRHFAGDKNICAAVADYAENRAGREFGIYVG